MGVFLTLLEQIVTNVGFGSVEALLVLIFFMGGMIMHIGSFLRGSMLNVILFAGLAMFLHSIEQTFGLALIIMFLYFIVLTLLLMFDYQRIPTGFI